MWIQVAFLRQGSEASFVTEWHADGSLIALNCVIVDTNGGKYIDGCTIVRPTEK